VLCVCAAQYFRVRADDPTSETVVPIPFIVAIICDVPPPSEIGIKSVMRAEEEIVSMASLKMDWIPYIPQTTTEKYVGIA